MTSIASTPAHATPAPQPEPAAAEVETRAGGGVQGFIGDLLRGAGSGYEQATKMTAVQADKAAIHPFETVSTATGILKEKTANLKGVNRATGLLHTIGGFAMLIMTANASGILRAPGATGSELAHKVADLIDGKQTATGFTPGWFMAPPAEGEGEAPAAREPQPEVPQSSIGSALSSLGMR